MTGRAPFFTAEELALDRLQRVEAVLSAAEGLRPIQVYEKLGGWSSPNGVRDVLRHLVRSGRAVREGDVGRFLYRKVEPSRP